MEQLRVTMVADATGSTEVRDRVAWLVCRPPCVTNDPSWHVT
ncbi:hypothetical protein AB0K16_56030 [Nonomuraea jabiensis]